MKSMTGYAKKIVEVEGCRLSIEIKTLNSKQLDLIVKMPQRMKSRELEVRNRLMRLERGKVEVQITEEAGSDTISINEELLAARCAALKGVAAKIGINVSADNSLLAIAAAGSDVWGNSTEQELSSEGWQIFFDALEQAIDDVDSFRTGEGITLKSDIKAHVDLIEELLNEIPQHEKERIETAKERIRKYMADANIRDIDQNRFEQELIYYLEKLDITEEKVRLKKHIDYFRDTMENEATCGKKLGFVAQEMGREINTTGSKANHVEIQRIVVAMKDELEKIKEQLGNIL